MPRNFFLKKKKKNWILDLKNRFFGFRPFSDHIFSHCFTYNGQTRAKFGEKLNLSVMKIFHQVRTPQNPFLGVKQGSKGHFSSFFTYFCCIISHIFVLTIPKFIKLSKKLYFGFPKIFWVVWSNFDPYLGVKQGSNQGSKNFLPPKYTL